MLYKNIGETPLERLERLRVANPDYKDASLSYLGRLDPIAEGILLVSVGENNSREEVLRMAKEYIVEILFGVETDTYDILGLITRSNTSAQISAQKIADKLDAVLGTRKGKWNQPYPPYSSKPVDGKPLFQWAREGRLNEISIPTKEVEIFSVEKLTFSNEEKTQLEKIILERIRLVKGDFRQIEISENWKKYFVDASLQLPILKIKVTCSSGTYMRSLAHEIGQQLGISALALSICRTKIGPYDSACIFKENSV